MSKCKYCERPAVARWMCNTHYQRWQHESPLEAPIREHEFHEMVGTPTYRCWVDMKQRCFNSNDSSYSYYGGRGITVCERWMVFTNFLEDMSIRPDNPPWWAGRQAYYSIDRIDNDGNYEPGNCRWATPEEQNTNKRARSTH